MWIQDIHFNRNPIIQTVIKEVDAELKKADINGKNEARAFAEHMKDIKSRAAKAGKSVNYNRMIKDGRFIRPYADKFDEDYNKLHADYVKSVQDTNSTTSIEALRAKWKKDASLLIILFLVINLLISYMTIKVVLMLLLTLIN